MRIQENNNHQLEKLWLLNKFSLAPQEMYREQYMENMHTHALV